MSRIALYLAHLVALWIPINTFGQSDKQSNFDTYLQINLEYNQLNKNNSIIGIFQPGFVLYDLKNAHEISLTALQVQKDSISTDFERQTFSAGARYQYRHTIARLVSGFAFWVGGSIEIDYRSIHFEPKWTGPTDALTTKELTTKFKSIQAS